MRKKYTLFLIALVVVAGIGAYFFFNHETALAPTSDAKTTKQQPAETQKEDKTFDKTAFSLTDPTSPWVVTNKHRPLNPKAYAPNDLVVPNIPLRGNITNDEKQLRRETASALEKMYAAAAAEGVEFNVQSGYRSYNFQVNLYNRYVQQQGQAEADSQSARPGYSEHQTGLTVDLGSTTKPSCNVETCYADTVEGKWLAANAYKFGFILRYPEGETNTTGYVYEPWHFRYVGTDLAAEMHKQNSTTLEAFFGLEAAPDYN